jgi:hypothetical protein
MMGHSGDERSSNVQSASKQKQDVSESEDDILPFDMIDDDDDAMEMQNDGRRYFAGERLQAALRHLVAC